MKTSLALLLAITFASCAPKYVMTPEEKTYVDAYWLHPTSFKLPKASSEEAWGRAQSFVGKYSSMKVQTVSDYIIETYNPSAGSYAYSITRTPMGDSVEFFVRCQGYYGNSKFTEQNAHICAHHIATATPVMAQFIAK